MRSNESDLIFLFISYFIIRYITLIIANFWFSSCSVPHSFCYEDIEMEEKFGYEPYEMDDELDGVGSKKFCSGVEATRSRLAYSRRQLSCLLLT